MIVKACKPVFFLHFILFCAGMDTVVSQTTGSRNIILNLPVVTLLDIEPNTNSITINFTASSEAGNPITNPSPNTTKWLNYTSSITQGGSTKNVSVVLNQTIPGINIQLQAGNATGGGGALGTPFGLVTVSTTPVNIITGIGGAYTGNGSGNGHQLTFSFTVSDYSDLVQMNQTVNVTYTISN